MNNGKPIRLPAYMVSLLAKWKRATDVLTERMGRAPTPDEVGKALRLSKRKIGIVAKAIRVNNLTPHSESSQDEGPALDDVLTDDRTKGRKTSSSSPTISTASSSISTNWTTARRLSFACGSASNPTIP